MTIRRLIAIAFVFLGTSVAWTVLGSSLVARSGEFNGRLRSETFRTGTTVWKSEDGHASRA